MSYTKIQFLAYVINTNFDTRNDTQVYLGLADTATDIAARCALMQRAMGEALNHAAGADTLKVFMAPEFFFRGVNGAYAMNDAIGVADAKPGAVSVITELQKLAADPKWADWLFVFGSIVCTSGSSDPTAKQEVYNMSLIQGGGPANQGPSGARVVLKQWLSDNDFIIRSDAAIRAAPNYAGGMLYEDMVEHITPAASSWYATSDQFNYRVGSETQQQNYDGGGIFSSFGVTFGMDICLDHLEGRLVRAQLPGDAQIQVQLVPSCGMNIQGMNVVAGPGGQVFSCDGKGFGAATLQMPPLAAAPIPNQVFNVSNAVLTPGDAFPAVAISDLYATNAPRSAIGVRPQTGKVDADAVAGAIVVYAPVNMPPATTVPGKLVTLDWIHKYADVEFSLVYDGNGEFQQALCRMSVTGSDLNRYAYAIPKADPRAYPKPLPLLIRGKDEHKRDGTVQMQLRPGSDGYQWAIWCKADIGAFQFEGNAIEFYQNPGLTSQANPKNDGSPRTVGMGPDSNSN